MAIRRPQPLQARRSSLTSCIDARGDSAARAHRASITVHSDGLSVTHRQGDQTLAERASGPSALHSREDQWEAIQYSNGVIGRRYFDVARSVIQFD